MSKRALIRMFLLCHCLSGWAATIRVTADRNPVNLNDSFQLVFSSDASPDGDPDFAPLENDFQILSQGKSEQSSWINGTSSRTIQWTLTVLAKQPGELTVPPVAFGNDRSNAMAITVTSAGTEPQTSGSDGADLFLDVAAAPAHPYVQAQILYTVKVYRRVDIAQATLSEPDVKDAVLEKLGEDSNYRTEVKGHRYVVTERKYAVFPQKSGALTIPPVELTAQIVDSGASRFDSFFSATPTRTQRVVSKALHIDVRAMPQEFKGGQWLPAEQVQLQEQWSAAIDQAKTGEPLTRTISISIKGATAGQLPDLGASQTPVAAPAGGELKAYPDQPEIKELKRPDGITAVRQEKIALIPSQAGEYRLPAIEIPWWNTRTQRLETARIPAQVIQAAASGSQAHPQVSPAPAPLQAPPEQPVPVAAGADAGVNIAWQLAAAVSTTGWLLTILYFWRRGKANAVSGRVAEPENSPAFALKALQKACREHNAKDAQNALLAWSKARFHESNLGAAATYCGPDVQAEINKLQQALYALETQPWHGEALWVAVQRFESAKPVRQQRLEPLEPLHKI